MLLGLCVCVCLVFNNFHMCLCIKLHIPATRAIRPYNGIRSRLLGLNPLPNKCCYHENLEGDETQETRSYYGPSVALMRLELLPPLPYRRLYGHDQPQLYANAYNSALLTFSCYSHSSPLFL